MKTTILSLFACTLAIQFGFAQQPDHVDGQSFLKQMTYNTLGGKDVYNQNIKNDFAKLLFGRTNSMVEYVYNPAFRDVLALSIAHDTLSGNYIMTIMRMVDSEEKMADVRWSLEEMALPDSIEADRMMTLYEFSALTAEKKYDMYRDADDIMKDILRNMVSHLNIKPPLSSGTPADSIISFADFRKAVEHRNRYKILIKATEKLYRQYRPVPTSIEVSKEFALKLHDKISILIRDFKAVRERKYNSGELDLMTDGESATFRCVVGDELWSLYVRMPQSRALELSDLLNQLIEEMEGSSKKKLNESKYIKLLDKIDL